MHAIDPQCWRRLRPLFDEALDGDGAQRAALLARVRDEAPELHDDLVRLLDEHDRADGRLQRPAIELAAPAIERSRAASPEARIGETVGAYRLTRMLGRGGMGEVYLAERIDGAFGQHVAMKVVRGVLGGAGERARFERERVVLAALSHPNIAALYDGGETRDGQPYYTMEYVGGSAITEFCEANALPAEARVHLLLQVAAGLAYAHQNLVVHRDIKPANVMVRADGRVKIVDFGIAKPLGEPGGTLTEFGAAPMTPEYAAPEQFRRQPVTVATDVYQFGALCYRVFGGHRPYRADPDDPLAWARAVVEQEPLPLGCGADSAAAERTRLRIDRDLDAIVRKAMASSPDRRYRSMDAVGADLEAWLDGRPITARRAGAAYFARRFVARHPYATAATALSIALLVATAVVALRQARIARSQAARAEAVANFLVDLFQVSDPGKNRGETLNANEILARGAQRIDDELSTEPEQRGRLLLVIGRVYSALGDFPRARAPLERAVAAFRAAADAEPRETALATHALATVALRELRFEDASKLLADEEALLARVRGDTTAARARLRQARGSALRQQGKMAEAKAEMAAARELALADAATSTDTLHQVDTALGLLECDLREYEPARLHLDEALAAARRLYAADDYRVATAAFNLGIARVNLGDAAGAAALMEPAVERIRAQFGEDNYRYAIMLNTLGTVSRERGDAAAALARFEASDRAFVAAFGKDHPERAWPLLNAARVLGEQGDFAGALARSEQALSIRTAKLGDAHPEVAHAWDAMAAALIPLGRYAEARDYAARALPVLRANMPPDHDAIVECLLHLGLAEHALGDEATARRLWDEALERAPRAFVASSVDLAALRAAIADPDRALHPR